MDSSGPAFEFNWGAIPRVQLHAILPFGSVHPLNNPVYLPSGTGSSAFGLTDMELGVKLAWIKQTKRLPQIGSFTMFEMLTGDSDKGLGVGKVWYKLPLWAYKDIGKWTLDGGAGYQVVPQDGFRNFPYGGFLAKREFGERLEIAAEVFSHAGEGTAPAQTEASTMIDAGGYYHLKGEGMQLLFAYGHSIAGQTENYAYRVCTGHGERTTRSLTSQSLMRRMHSSKMLCSRHRLSKKDFRATNTSDCFAPLAKKTRDRVVRPTPIPAPPILHLRISSDRPRSAPRSRFARLSDPSGAGQQRERFCSPLHRSGHSTRRETLFLP